VGRGRARRSVGVRALLGFLTAVVVASVVPVAGGASAVGDLS
jgi:hypothetical protein